ncbi:tetratricopeptide repeat protein [Streptomyces monomycini]|uniref:tetratricopeptide repeat protein n=1 Tax=Streptomyces monomycini TaxID=371720 RepID=UPI00067AFF5C|nr:tetratricopeptide repeat protein [Streptomyces monomycini]
MNRRRLSRQELIRARSEDGFVGRDGELSAFRANLARDPADPDFRFLHHLRGQGGVGKTSLVQRFEHMARELGALTVYVDDSVHSVPDAMAVISTRLGRQGSPLKAFDKLLATYRERRHEAEAAALAGPDEPGGEPPPSPGSMIVARAGVAGLGLIPGVGPFAGALDTTHVARGAERLRGRLGARLGSHDDVQLVLSPVEVLTPVFVKELGDAADAVPLLVLFFDTYEATGPLLDTWLRDVLFSDRYGALAQNVVVVLAGRDALDRICWADHLDHVTDVPLDAFTEAEVRQFLSAKDITDPGTVDAILRLSGGLPVLVSTLAGSRPGAADAVDDPSDTAVERFLKWETDPVRREAALAAALPCHLDEDVYREAVGAEAAGHFGWLCALPFVTGRGGRWQYHEVVRTAMLRLQRRRSPRAWAERHGRLAETARRWGQECAGGRGAGGCRRDERWRDLRLGEIYHGLCADPRGFLPEALSEVTATAEHEPSAVRLVAETVRKAGEDADASEVRDWGTRLTAALDGADGLVAVLTALLARPGLDLPEQVRIHRLRGREHRKAESWQQALADFDRCLELAPGDVRGLVGRGLTYRYQRDFLSAAMDLLRARNREPGMVSAAFQFAEVMRLMGWHKGALAAFDHTLELDPRHAPAHGSRAVCLRRLGRCEEALAGLARAIELRPGYAWAMAERGMAYWAMGRYAEAFAEFDRALARNPEYGWAYGARGSLRLVTGRLDAALADLDTAVGQGAATEWTFARRATAHLLRGAEAAALADCDRALAADGGGSPAFLLAMKAGCLRRAHRPDAAREAVEAAAGLAPDRPVVRYETAMLASADAGLQGAASAWEALRTATEECRPPGVSDPAGGARAAVVSRCALGDWEGARASAAGLLGDGTAWEHVADVEFGIRDLTATWPERDATADGELEAVRQLLLHRMDAAAAGR